jgi:AraC-like DNA-binding protein
MNPATQADAPDATVYLGNDWLMYASATLVFERSECVAPALLLGTASHPLQLRLDCGKEATGSTLIHGAGVWSSMEIHAAGAVLYVDPLSLAGSGIQGSTQGDDVVLRSTPAIERLQAFLPCLIDGHQTASTVSLWIAEAQSEMASWRKKTPDPRLSGLRRWFVEHLEGRIGVGELAAMLALAPDHFRQHFRRHAGMTLSRYQAWLRLHDMTHLACEAHCRHAEQDAASVTQAAGFYDASHANRTTRRYLDMTPAEMLAPPRFMDCRTG